VIARRACSALAAVLGALALSAPGAAAAVSSPSLSVRAAALVAQDTGQQLYGQSASDQLAIASTTKLMTALVTLQHASMNQVFAYPGYSLATADSQIGLARGERMTVHDLFVAMMLPSADDAAYDLAYNVGHGSVARFIAMMNADARRLGLTHTHYSTPIGLDTPGNYSSASDLVKLAGYLLQRYPLFAQVVGEPSAVLRSGGHIRSVVNRNDLVAHYPWIHGVKTGHTADAGYVLVAAARQNGMTLISAVLGTSSEAARDRNSLALLGWGFQNFRLATPVTEGHVLARPSVPDQPGLHAVVAAATTLRSVIPRTAVVKVKVKLRRSLAGPLARGTIVGRALVLAGGSRIGQIPVRLAKAIPAVSTLTRVMRFITRGSTLLLLAVLVGSAAVLIVRRRQQGRARPTAA
jgi:serine-type D-Ala-D-Ala carboxypeptidase (penicillin-binding protein 5/6)